MNSRVKTLSGLKPCVFLGKVARGVAEVGSLFPRVRASLWESCGQKGYRTVARAQFVLQTVEKIVTFGALLEDEVGKIVHEINRKKLARSEQRGIDPWQAGLQLEVAKRSVTAARSRSFKRVAGRQLRAEVAQISGCSAKTTLSEEVAQQRKVVRPSIQLFIHPAIHPSSYSSIHPSIHPSILSFIGSLIHGCMDSLIQWFIVALVH